MQRSLDFLLPHLKKQTEILLAGRLYFPSQRLETLDLGESVAVFHGVFHQVHCFERDAFDIFRGLSKGIRKEDISLLVKRFGLSEYKFYSFLVYLLENHLLLPSDHDIEKQYIEDIRSRYRNSSKLTNVSLLLTLDCNRRCHYCGVRKADYLSGIRRTEMSKALIRKILNFVAWETRQDDSVKSVTFFGGEPLLKVDLIEYTVTRAKEMGDQEFGWQKPIFKVVTNGILMDQEVARMCAAYDISVFLSLDTPINSIQDESRCSFRSCLSNIHKTTDVIGILKEWGILTGFLISVSSTNIHIIPDMIGWLAQHTSCKEISFNFLVGDVEGENALYVGPPDYEAQLDEIIDSCEQFGMHCTNLDYFLNLFRSGNLSWSSCPGTSQMVIDPDGYTMPCPFATGFDNLRAKFSNGTNELRSMLFESWRNRIPWNLDHCTEKCNIFSVCGGRCMYNAHVLTGDIYKHHPASCDLNRYLFRKAFKKIALEPFQKPRTFGPSKGSNNAQAP